MGGATPPHADEDKTPSEDVKLIDAGDLLGCLLAVNTPDATSGLASADKLKR